MLVSDLTVEVRNSSLTRVGQILASDLIGFQASLRFNNVGAWKLELKSNHPMVSALKTPGSGLIITGKTGVLLSGPTISATSVKTSDDVVGTWEFIGTDDSIILGERLAYPYPASADVSAQADDYDERTGVAETVVKAYVNANIGPSAPAARRVTGLTIQTDTGLGNTVRGFARFDNLGVLCSQLVASSGLGFEIAQVGSGLEFQTFMPTDRSATIRMDIDNLRLTKSEYTFSSPGATRVIVAGQGEGIARTFVEVSNTASTTAETSWARRIETFLDQRQTNDTTALTQAGQGVLAEVGFTREGFSVTPSDDQTMSYGTDWGLGDKVTVVVDTTEVKKVVTEVAIIIDSDGVKVGATVGDPDTANKTDTESNLISTQSSQNDRISVLERNEFPSEKEIIRVANTTGATLTKGTVVYPTGSTGTNKTVAKAQANAEATSTNTFAVLNEDIPNNNKGSAVTFGMVSNIDTSALTEGAAVWLSPTVAGGFTSTKPSAPNHMVLVGFCIRAHASVGSIFVKIQNGFELNELHDVAITSPVAGQTLVRNSGNTGWINGDSVPAGVINQYAGATAPTGYLLCQGQELAIASYGTLYAVVGTLYGALTNGAGAAGTTHFRIPDLQTRVPVGKKADNTGTFGTLNNKGGAETHTLTSAQIPAHSHPNTLSSNVVASSSHYHNHVYGTGLNSGTNILLSPNDGQLDNYSGSVNYIGIVGGTGQWMGGSGGVTYERYATSSGGPSATTTVGITNANNTGGDGAHNILQPYITLNFIIKT